MTTKSSILKEGNISYSTDTLSKEKYLVAKELLEKSSRKKEYFNDYTIYHIKGYHVVAFDSLSSIVLQFNINEELKSKLEEVITD